jgi:hypothetical protein
MTCAVVKDEGGKKSHTRNARAVLVDIINEIGRIDGPLKDDNKEVQNLMDGITKVLQENAEEYAYPVSGRTRCDSVPSSRL